MSFTIGANPFSQQNLQFGGGSQGSVGGTGGGQGINALKQTESSGAAGGAGNLLQGANLAQFNPNHPRHDRMFVASA